jgi:hypothetical protein
MLFLNQLSTTKLETSVQVYQTCGLNSSREIIFSMQLEQTQFFDFAGCSPAKSFPNSFTWLT